ncbi:MAG: acyltransferase [Candidatus Dormibacteraceae bacterium]
MGLDAVRVLALVLVVAIHCDHWPNQTSGVNHTLWTSVDLVARVCVPIFMVLSGFLLTYNRQRRMPLRTFARRRLGRSLLPWAVWMPVYTVIGMYLTHEVTPTVSGVASWWALGGGHLWYLLLIPQFYVVFQFWPVGRRAVIVVAVLALAFQIALDVYRLHAPSTAPLNGFFLAHGYQVFFFWIGYFAVGTALGVLVREHEGPLPPAWPFWLLTAAGVLVLLLANGSRTPNASFAQGTGAFLLPVLPLATIAVFVAVGVSGGPGWAKRPAFAQVLRTLGRYALGIYIVHEALTYIPGPLQLIPFAQTHLLVATPIFLFQVAVTLALAYMLTRLLAAGPLAITIGLPPEPLRWSRWRRPLEV